MVVSSCGSIGSAKTLPTLTSELATGIRAGVVMKLIPFDAVLQGECIFSVQMRGEA